jgi:response regulator RpfG family c-di-GMP phosphodiesterase
MEKRSKKILIVDDDPQNNSLSMMVLRKALGEVDIKDFIIPENALKYIESEFLEKQCDEAVTLFLDINMPTLTGWEFLEIFDTFNDSIKKQFNIFMLSSTIDPADIQRALDNPLVKDFIEKPLSRSVLERLFR